MIQTILSKQFLYGMAFSLWQKSRPYFLLLNFTSAKGINLQVGKLFAMWLSSSLERLSLLPIQYFICSKWIIVGEYDYQY